MSKISIDEVKKIAKLSRLRLTEKEAEEFAKQFDSLLLYFEQLNEIDTDNVKPASHSIPLKNVYREDKAVPSYDRQIMMKNVPDEINGLVRVPKILESQT